MKRLVLFSLLVIVGITAGAQSHRIFFKDKGPQATYYFQHPLEMLSQDALVRRAVQSVPLQLSDMPVSTVYLSQVQATGVEINGYSRWLNMAWIQATPEQIDNLKALSFIDRIEVYTPLYAQVAAVQKVEKDYGFATIAVAQIHANQLHQLGYTGQGVTICLMDAGFYGVDSLQFFRTTRDKGQIRLWKDFHQPPGDVFDADWHGTGVLSCIAVDSPGVLVGTAFDADFLLARTEVTGSETHQEELNYVMAAEWADSIGTDIIHSSLGYSRFDTLEGNYTYADMDGNTTIVTQAADMAASKGILVTSSAGNEGAGTWLKITAPCDGDSVLCIGAVDKDGKIADFSSHGPSTSGKVKPEVVALGLQVTLVGANDSLRIASGTSFSGPLVAGLAACLKQAFPQHSNMDIIHAITMSGNKYPNNDTLYGYGIPNGLVAYQFLTQWQQLDIKPVEALPFKVYPNPASDWLQIMYPEFTGDITLTIFDAQGRRVYHQPMDAAIKAIPVMDWSNGLYILRVNRQQQAWSTRFMVNH